MSLVKVKMLISRHTTAGAKSKGDMVSLPVREAAGIIARGHAVYHMPKSQKKVGSVKTDNETLTIEKKPDDS